MNTVRFSLVLLLLALPTYAQRSWDFDTISSEPIRTWHFRAVTSTEDALPDSVDGLGLVELPWQVERTRARGYWLTTINVPQRFQGRAVYLEVEGMGTVHIYLDGTEVSAGTRRASAPVKTPAGSPLSIAIAMEHSRQPAILNKARLVAVPPGFRDYVAYREKVLKALPEVAEDAVRIPWRVKVNDTTDASQPDYDDSAWETVDNNFRWEGNSTPCWWRGTLRIPEQILNLPTAGKALNLRGKFDDAATVYLNGEKLEEAITAPDSTALRIPDHFKPGDEVQVAINLMNHWGSGGLEALEWRFTDFDAAENTLYEFNTLMYGLDRTLSMHDQPQDTWVDGLNAVCTTLAGASTDPAQYPAIISKTMEELATVKVSIDASPVPLLAPYLQDVRADQVTIMWETSAPVDSSVLYGKTERDTKVEDTSPQAMGIHEVVLSDLEADTEYQYQFISGDYVSKVYSVHTAPEKPRPFKFLIWGDNRSDPDMCERISLLMDTADAEFVINVGDVVARGSRWHEWTEQYLIPVRHWSHKWPSYVAIGNHEYGGIMNNDNVPGFDQYLAHPTIEPGSTEYWYSFDYANSHFIFMDGNKFDEIHEGEENDWTINPADPQLIWIEEDLKAAQGRGDWIFGFIHEPPYSEGWSGGYYDGEGFLRNSLVPILEQYGVDMLFAGHTHDYERGLPHPPYDPETGEGNTITHIITGGGGANLDNHKYKEWTHIDIPDHPADPSNDRTDEGEYYKYHYCWMEVDGTSLKFEAREVLPNGRDGGVFDRFQLKKE